MTMNQEELSDLLKEIDPSRIPQHIAIIMDGNRRWAKKHNVPTLKGHYEGAEALMRVVKDAADLGVKTLTVYAFSTENWTRPLREVKALMSLFKVYLLAKRESMRKEGVQLSAIGDLSKLPKTLRQIFFKTEEMTRHGSKIKLILALNYGSRSEIIRSFAKMLEDYDQKKFSKEDLSESLFASYLDTKDVKDPELLIRTSGEMRISNFLLWQISYAEIHVTDVLWPDFTKYDLLKAIREYQRRERRLGGT
jgi:undecaprenyl diphosphate synthase